MGLGMRRGRQEVLRRGMIWAGPVFLAGFALIRTGSLYGFSFFPDEFSYWAYAADLAGYDWSELVSLGSYFSFGYGWLLFPIFILCRDAVAAYRAAVCLNFVFLAGAYALLVYAAGKLLPDREMPAGLFGAAAVLTPWNLFYAQTTLTESFLIFLYAAAGVLLLRYLEKDRLSVLAGLVLVLSGAYTVHMRTVGILLSALLALFIHLLPKRKIRWHFLAAVGLTGLLLGAAWVMKRYALEHIYGGIDPELTAGNDYSGQLDQLRYICTGEGFRDFLITVLGGFLYLGLASFGLFYWGMYVSVRDAGRLLAGWLRGSRIRRKNDRAQAGAAELTGAVKAADVRGEMGMFILLSVLAQVLIASVYLLRRGEIDDYTYGRYSELVLPFLMAEGLAALWKARKRAALAATGVLAVLQGAGLWLVVRQIGHTGASIFRGCYMIGISYLYERAGATGGGEPAGFHAGRFYAGAWVLCEMLTLLTVFLVFAARSGRGREILLTALLVLEMGLAGRVSLSYLNVSQLGAFRDYILAKKISAMSEEGRNVYFIDDSGEAYIDILQFMARDTRIHLLTPQEGVHAYGNEISPTDLVILPNEEESSREWADKYERNDTYGHFTLLYNELE